MSFWCLQFFQKQNKNHSTWGTYHSSFRLNFSFDFWKNLKYIPKKHFEINFSLQFIYSEKATKFCEISIIFLTVTTLYVVSIKRTGSLNCYEVFFHPVRLLHPVCLIDTTEYIGQIYGRDFAKFCGLLRIYELYQAKKHSFAKKGRWNSFPCISLVSKKS